MPFETCNVAKELLLLSVQFRLIGIPLFVGGQGFQNIGIYGKVEFFHF